MSDGYKEHHVYKVARTEKTRRPRMGLACGRGATSASRARQRIAEGLTGEQQAVGQRLRWCSPLNQSVVSYAARP